MEQELRDFGLTDKEIKVYLACLYLGSALVQDIAKRAGTYRTYTYEVLKSLKEKGLVSYVIRLGKQYFEVAPPDKLLSIINEKKDKINMIMPELKGLYNLATDRPTVEVYEGKEGLKTILDDLLKTKREWLVYCSTRKQIKLLTFNFPNFIKRRYESKIPVKVVCEKSSMSLDLHSRDKAEFREMRFLEGIEFPTATYIYGNKVAILSLEKEIFGVVIDDETIAKTQRLIFNSFWKMAKNR